MNKISISVKVAERSLETGRNGCFDIARIWAYASNGWVFIDGISRARGVTLRGGFRIDVEAMDELAKKWLEARDEDTQVHE